MPTTIWTALRHAAQLVDEQQARSRRPQPSSSTRTARSAAGRGTPSPASARNQSKAKTVATTPEVMWRSAKYTVLKFTQNWVKPRNTAAIIPRRPMCKLSPLDASDQEHGDRGDGEAIGDRPLRRDLAELAADHDPGRAPDRGEDDERQGDGPEITACCSLTRRRSRPRAARPFRPADPSW